MYAVIKTGGKQHKVKEGDTLSVELLEGEPGDKVTFEPLLVVDDSGATHVGKEAAGATVTATLAGEIKAKKVKVFKYKPKTGYKRTQGHRQQYTVLEVESIDFKAPKKAPAKKATPAEEAPAETAPEAPVSDAK
jgi:large subunit ribosomal protein L21